MSHDWLKLRPWSGSQQTAFEKLCGQLFAHEPVPASSVFVAKGSPDAGVESYWTLPNGDEWANQAKFFLHPLNDSQWQQIQDSLYSAVEHHPRLTRYIVCVPQDRADPRIEKQKWFMDKWKEKAAAWTQYAHSKGVTLTVEYWGEHELLDRLTKPAHRGKLLFWFNDQIFTTDWLQSKIAQTIANVGPRYTPELNVQLPIVSVFDGLGHTPEFFDLIRRHKSKIKKAFGRTSLGQARKETAVKWGTLDDSCTRVITALEEFKDESVTEARIKGLSELSCAARDRAWDCIEGLRKVEDARRREQKVPRTESMYSYEEYRLQELASDLDNVAGFCNSSDASAAVCGALLLVGAAGTGKTHFLCDVAAGRIAKGQPTFLLQGTDFEDKEPLIQIAGPITGLQMNRDDFLAAADTAGEATGSKCAILIDAVNEGEGYLLWRKQLPGLLVTLRNYPNVVLAVSVRDTYEDVVIPKGLEDDVTRVVHLGFAGHEYKATKTFFDHYKLKAPSIPLLNPEFDNPQFLKLFCTTLANLGESEVPRGLPGLTAVFQGFLDSVNEKLALPDRLDFDSKDKLVHRAVDALVGYMVKNSTHWVPRDDAKQAINALTPNHTESRSLFRHLLSEGVIYENRAYSMGSDETVEVVEFAFERFTDHLIARRMLSALDTETSFIAAFEDGGSLRPLTTKAPTQLRRLGLLEALSIQVPQKYRHELMVLVPAIRDWRISSAAFLNSVLWREFDAFTKESLDLANELVRRQPGFENDFLRCLLLVAATPEHPWNANFLHKNLVGRTLTRRDASWSIFVFRESGEHGPVDRLIEWAWSEESKSHIDDTSLELAATALTWFLTTSNRYARDRATKGLVSLLTERLTVLVRLIDRFQNVDDVYVLERLYAAAYGCAMRSSNVAGLTDLAEVTFNAVFANGRPIPHILLRDYARGVIEVASHMGCQLKFDPKRARPPYQSEWIEPTFKEGELESWEKWWDGMPREEWARVHLHHSIMGEEDFARYVIGTNFGSFEWTANRLPLKKRRGSKDDEESRFDLRVAQRWIMRRVIDLGWTTELFGHFDRYMVEGSYSRTAHKAERIGKKYQWMAYHEFLARVSDNFEFVGDHWSKKNDKYDGPWQAGFIRDIDPSCPIESTHTDRHARAWWQPSAYDAWDVEPSNEKWVAALDDLPDPTHSIRVKDTQGTSWLALESYFSFDQKTDDAEFTLPRRTVWYQIHGYLVKRRKVKQFFKWAQEQDFMGRWMPESHSAHTLFLGEFFWSPAFRYLQQPYYSRGLAWSSRTDRGQHVLPAKIAMTTDQYYHEAGFDCSIEDTITLALPSELIFQELGLTWNTRAGEYIDANGLLTVQYPCAYQPGPASMMVREDALCKLLQKKDLAVVWTVLAEKTVLTDQRDQWPGRLELSGAYTLDSGALVGRMNQKHVRPKAN